MDASCLPANFASTANALEGLAFAAKLGCAVADLRRVSRAHGGTLNDGVLALSAAALRRFLLEQEALPEAPLTTMVPVNNVSALTVGTGGRDFLMPMTVDMYLSTSR